MDNLIDRFYGQAAGFVRNFFAEIGNMGAELFGPEGPHAIILFSSQLSWALFGVSLVVSAFEFGVEYSPETSEYPCHLEGGGRHLASYDQILRI